MCMYQQQCMSHEEKVTALTQDYRCNMLVAGTFVGDKEILIGMPSLTFEGSVCGVGMTISVC